MNRVKSFLILTLAGLGLGAAVAQANHSEGTGHSGYYDSSSFGGAVIEQGHFVFRDGYGNTVKALKAGRHCTPFDFVTGRCRLPMR